jgi:hypothetical protein
MSANHPLPEPDPQPQPGPPPEPELEAPAATPEPRLRLRRKRVIKPLRFGPPFWTITGALSLVVNIILIVVLLSLASQLFALKKLVQEQLLGGLYENFVLMDQAHIRTSIPVNTNVPAKFDLPLQTNTVVILTEPTLLENATVASLSTGGLTITNAPATILLAEGTRLPVALDIVVPVDQQIPVSLLVNVDIPLSQTDLHQPFVGLQETVRPYYLMLEEIPDNWADILCGSEPGKMCENLFR